MKQSNLKVIGVTGGVGAGKSEVLKYLASKPFANVYELDKVAHDLQQPGEACYESIRSKFGDDILAKDKSIDRVKLGQKVFKDKENLSWLNELIHPAVMKFIRDEITRQPQGIELIVIEGALLIEAGYREVCHEFWYIQASPQVRCQRVMDTRGYTKERFESIMKNQLSHDMFINECDVIIDNSEDRDKLYKRLEGQLGTLLGEI